MRILMISTDPITKNGITSVITNIVSSINDNGIVFDLACLNTPDQSYYDLFQAKGGQVYCTERNVKHPLRYIRRLTHIIKMNNYDIIHAHGNSSSLLLEMISGILGRTRIRIAHSHNTTCSSIRMHRILNPLFQITYTYALACGIDAGKWLYGDKEFRVIKNGITIEKFAFVPDDRITVRKQLGIEDRTFLLGHVGVFNDQKNQKYLISILGQIIEYIPNAKLMLIGDGRNRPAIVDAIDKNGLEDKVFLVGNVSDVKAYLSAMDMIVMPSLYEGLPLALIEEQANGLTCLVSDRITEEVNLSGNVNFISLDNENDWISHIRKYYENYNNENRLQKSANAMNKIKEEGYSIADEAEKLRLLYYALVKNK